MGAHNTICIFQSLLDFIEETLKTHKPADNFNIRFKHAKVKEHSVMKTLEKIDKKLTRVGVSYNLTFNTATS